MLLKYGANVNAKDRVSQLMFFSMNIVMGGGGKGSSCFSSIIYPHMNLL